MKKATWCLMSLVLLGVWTVPVLAIPAFKTEFDAMYVKKDSTDAVETAFAEAAAKAKCNVCHEGNDKKKRNRYGMQLSELLDKKEDAKNKEKIRKALEEVAGKKADPDKADSPTFGELITSGKLPGEG